ncbi:MAG TPA: phosphatase PAP2 family protein [Rubrivivax sp.]|nr:phosphatase PAP2 family protein [Rubrivivax sp.]
MGIDGVMGMPGYSGYVPNSMLAGSLVLSRDLLLAGNAQASQVKVNWPQHWMQGSKCEFPAPGATEALKRLQPNLRMLLVEQSLFDGIKFDYPTTGADQPASLSSGSDPLLAIHRPTVEVIQHQCAKVLSYADLRGERVNEVLAQVVPQVANWSATLGLHPERHKYTLELLGVGLSFATKIVMRFKHALGVPRPGEVSPLVHPMILTPGHRAFPSGHATEAYFAAEFLSALFCAAGWKVSPGCDAGEFPFDPNASSSSAEMGLMRPQLHRIAYRVAENRVVAGVHYPVDSLAGQALGIVLAQHLVGLACPGFKSELFGKVFAANAKDAEPRLDCPWPEGIQAKQQSQQGSGATATPRTTQTPPPPRAFAELNATAAQCGPNNFFGQLWGLAKTECQN